MKIKAITSFLENIAPLSYQESYDNAGLIVGNPEAEAEQALICLDCTEPVVDEAIQKGCGLIIAHHPIVFKGLKKFNGKNYVERVVMKAIKHDVAIYAAHTNLDNVNNGVSAKICDLLGVKNYDILAPQKGIYRKLFTFCPIDKADKVRQGLFDAGCGHIGEYGECSFNTEGTGTFKGSENTDPYVGERNVQHQEKEEKIETIYPAYLEGKVIEALIKAHPYEEVAYDIVSLENEAVGVGSGMIGELEESMDEMEFLKQLKTTMKTGCVRHTPLRQKKIKRVAVCGGAGSFLLPAAMAKKADVFITGDFKYHQFFDAEGKIIIADIGHYESEQFTKELFYELLTENFPTFALHLSEINTNPINYL